MSSDFARADLSVMAASEAVSYLTRAGAGEADRGSVGRLKRRRRGTCFWVKRIPSRM
jgi:hypothetical protein